VLLGLLGLQLLPPWLNVQPGVYALVGATAMLGAVFRSSISLVVIIVEGTRGIGGHAGHLQDSCSGQSWAAEPLCLQLVLGVLQMETQVQPSAMGCCICLQT
jgi:hypothetical protein